MRVLFDYQIFQLQKFGGISRYFFELISQFTTTCPVQWELPIYYSSNEYLKKIPVFENALAALPPPPAKRNDYKEFMWGWHFKGKWQLYALKKQLFPGPAPLPDLTNYNKELSIAKLKEGNFDVFHPTYYDDYFLDYIGEKPYVLTIYDMIHEVFPEYFLQGSDADKKRLLATKAARIIAISENTKRDVVQFLDIPEEKVEVTYLGNSINPNSQIITAKINIDLPARYLLFVGNRNIYKNFYFFVQAILPLLEEDLALNIVCTGRPLDHEEKAFLQKMV